MKLTRCLDGLLWARRFRTVLRLLAAGALCLLLAGPASAGRCRNPKLTSVTFSPSVITAMTAGSSGTTTGTVTTSCALPPGSGNVYISYSSVPDGGPTGSIAIVPGTNSAQFTYSPAGQLSASTAYTETAVQTSYGSATAQAVLTVNPYAVSASLSPGSITVGSSQQVLIRLSVAGGGNTQAPGPSGGVVFRVSSTPGGLPLPSELEIVNGASSVEYYLSAGGITQTGTYQITFADELGGPSAAAALAVVSSSPPSVENGTNVGPCGRCLEQAGHPINLTSGDVYVPQRDYALPGLGGGLELSRTWNSLESNIGAPSNYGAFGLNWRSTYEERLSFPDGNTAKYWRGDGSAWTFNYNSPTHDYSLASPPNQHVSMYLDAGTNQYVMTFADGTVRRFTQPGLLVAIVDRNGNQVTLTYDGSNRLTQVADAASRTLTFNYGNANFPNLVSSIQDATGTIAQYTYDGNQNLTEVLYPDGSALNMAYDAANMLLNVNDAQGKLIEAHTYDVQNRGLTSTRANGADQVSVTYTAQGTTTLSDSMANTTTYGWQTIAGHNFVNSVTGPGCASCGGRGNQTLVYDASGNVSSSTDALGRTTNFTYDSMGNVLTRSIVLDGNNLIWSYTYNQFQEVLTATDPMNNVTTNTYDAHGNLLSSTTPPPSGTGPGLTTNFTYNGLGELTQVSDPRGNPTTIAYFPTGLISSVTDAQGNSTTFVYDARGNRTSSTDALSNTTTFGYDSMNRLTSIVQPGNISTSFGYDSRGRRTSVTDANNKTTTYSYDDADRLLSVTDAAQHETIYGYDTENHLQAITDALGRVTSFSYDDLGRVTGVTFPSTLTESYTYDAVGNLTAKTDRKGQTITYVYDNLDRLTSKSYPDSTSVAYTYDNDSRLTQVVDPTGTYGFTYDHVGRLTGTSTQYSFLTGRTLTTSYSYDAASNRTSLTDPEGGVTSYAYDTLNRLTGLTDFSNANSSFSYDALGRRTNLARPNGVSTSYTYDNLSRLLQVLHQKGSSLVESADYTYDSAGNRLSRTETTPAKHGTVVKALGYNYDEIYQLTQTTVNGSASDSYTYDAVGNRLSDRFGGPYTYNDSNQMLSYPAYSWTYDNNGNTTSETVSGVGTTSYTWDYENRLVSVTLPGTGGTVSFKYDPFGRRIQKVSPAGTTVYAYDGDNIVEQMDAAGTPTVRYTQGLGIDEPLEMTIGRATYYYHADGLGSITELTKSNGSAVNTYSYDPFGGVSPASSETVANPFKFTAREWDSETSLYYYRARYYDPLWGRFLSEDPIGFLGGADFYRYAVNSPTNFVDPLGLADCIYSISEHIMICTSNGPPPPVGPQWQIQLGPNGLASGAGECRNKPGCVDARDEGPIQPGRYRMNLDTRPEHQGWGLYRLESWPHHWYDGLMYYMGEAGIGNRRGGFELHIGSVTYGCINADKTNPQAVNQYHSLQKLLQAQDGSNFLTVVK